MNAQPSAYLDIAGVVRRFGANTVLDGISLKVDKGEFVSLLGSSGCGKTTLLRAIAGLTPVDRGRITVGGEDVTALPAHKRNIGVVFQNYALFPHLSVGENVAFGLRTRRQPKAEIAQRVAESLALVRLGELRDRPIQTLSGGQQQRVAIARALAVRPALILLDEPLSALDRNLRDAMQVELRELLRTLGMTVIFVTHDQDEAMALSDRIAVMRSGAFEQVADPAGLYRRPASLFVLEFVGQSNRVAGTVTGGSGGVCRIETPLGPLLAAGNFIAGAPIVAGIRPEHIKRARGEVAGENRYDAPVVDWVYRGARVTILLRSPIEQPFRVELDADEAADLRRGDMLAVTWRAADTLLFPAP